VCQSFIELALLFSCGVVTNDAVFCTSYDCIVYFTALLATVTYAYFNMQTVPAVFWHQHISFQAGVGIVDTSFLPVIKQNG
jgi:hypothetical protein